jgi:FkbM family methyltransferase
MKERFKTFSYMPDFTNLQLRSRHKVLWMHDTFCDGDDLIDTFLLDGYINEVFVLSDFHLDYVTNCDHGKRRMFEVMKKYMFVTRNGMTKYHDWVDITKKDPNHFVYNSSVTKGMRPLVNRIWPRIRQSIPDAKLTIIGGYYRMRSDHEPDQQEIEWRQMVENNPDINFTGIIKQSEIADILCNASYMIYPCDFPETFGISTLESLCYNTPVISCYFGAMEETAFDAACYKIPYPVVPNGLFPYINQDEQVERFVQTTIRAYHDKYLHQQKMYACNAVKDICGWDSVAMQWKQHFFHKLGEYMPVDEYRKAQEINYKVRKTFGRRFINEEEVQPIKNIQKSIGIITAVFNAENYIEKCIRSVASQDYKHYTIYIVDDCSTDNTISVIKQTIESLPEDLRHKFVLIKNKENIGAVANHYKIIDECQGDEDFYMILDGDDWLANDPNIFHKYNNLYHDGAEFTYGSCWSLVDNIPLVAQPYPPEVKQAKSYRQYKFNWHMPYTHMRTFHAKLLKDLTADDLKINGQWPKAGGDTALFYYLIEKADPEKVVCVTDINYVYNDMNPINDYKVNGEEQNRTANAIINGGKKLYTVVVPTMWKYEPFFNYLNELLNCPDVGEVILIDNDPTKTPLKLPFSPKLRYQTFGTNIYVNPAWNWGVENAKYDYVCILNDDMRFDFRVFEGLRSVLENPNTGVCGIVPGIAQYNQIPITDGNYQIIPWQDGMHQFGYGCLMFVNKNAWTHIPEEIKMYYGDYFIFDKHLAEGRTNYCIVNLFHETPYAQTCVDLYIKDAEAMSRLQNRETEHYENIKRDIWNKPAEVVEEQPVVEMPREKTILIAIPTNKNIEAATFKSIFDLKVPKGYRTEFQYFYGYQIDQIRNLIAEWGKHHDYLFCVDSDIVLPNDALLKMIGWDVDVISGLYIQRIPGSHTLELYEDIGNGGVANIPWENIKKRIGLMEIAACGFGCVLIKGEVLRGMEYPHFVYKSAINHAHTFSEDVYFCQKAREAGFKVWADTTILCDHVGSFTFKVDEAKPKSVIEYIRDEDRLPKEQVEYLHSISDLKPRIVYDIGACVLHWERHAKAAWPDAKFVLFDAEPGVERILMESGHPYHIGLLTDRDGRQLDFYHWLENPGGNSYYKEINPGWEEHKVTKTGYTLDTIVKLNNFPLPDLIKIDVQGAEIDVLKGAKMCIEHCTDVILEAQHKVYNEGAPNVDQVLEFMDALGFELVANINRVEFDGDYHFKKKL